MNIDLKEMFSEKNQDLFLNKLIIDLDNNTDTFKLTSKNIIKIELAKLLSSLRRIYNKYLVNIDEEKLKEVLSNNKNTMLIEINLLIDKKCEQNKQYIKDTEKKDNCNNKYIKSYHKHINDVEKEFEDNLNLVVRETAETGIYQKIINIRSCANEEMHQEVLKTINTDFASNLISRISQESIHRNRTLKNMSEETYSWYSNLNKSSLKIKSSEKTKILKN